MAVYPWLSEGVVLARKQNSPTATYEVKDMRKPSEISAYDFGLLHRQGNIEHLPGLNEALKVCIHLK
jgi:hypothetical protein